MLSDVFRNGRTVQFLTSDLTTKFKSGTIN